VHLNDADGLARRCILRNRLRLPEIVHRDPGRWVMVTRTAAVAHKIVYVLEWEPPATSEAEPPEQPATHLFCAHSDAMKSS